MDVLSEVLNLLRLKAHVYFHARLCGAWTYSSRSERKASFHIIEQDSCWLHLPNNSAPTELHSGDLLFFPNNTHHIICDTIEPPQSVEPGMTTSAENNGHSTKIICGFFEFESDLANPILNALPDVIHIKSNDPNNTAWLETLIQFINRETETESIGSTALVDKLCDVLFVQIIRSWLNYQTNQKGFLAALADPQLSRALEQFHQTPDNNWTVESLAQSASMSRAAFAKRFHLLMGTTPMHYVSHWRMQLAYEQLKTTRKSIAQIAEECAYQSEASFRKAFKHHIGIPPGAVKKSKLSIA